MTIFELLSVPPISRAAPVPSAPPLFNYKKDFPPLSRQPIELPSLEPRKTSFGDFGTISPVRNKPSNITPLPSKPSVDNFPRSITQLTNEKNNTIEITPKKSVLPPIGQKQLSEQLELIFPDVYQMIQQQSETFKERTENVEELINAFTKSDDYDADEQKIFEFEFFTGGVNQKFNSFVRKFGLTTENLKFLDFLQTDYCKEILVSNDLKIHIETENIYYDDTDTNEWIFEFMKNQQDSSKGIINTDLKYERSYKNYFQ